MITKVEFIVLFIPICMFLALGITVLVKKFGGKRFIRLKKLGSYESLKFIKDCETVFLVVGEQSLKEKILSKLFIASPYESKKFEFTAGIEVGVLVLKESCLIGLLCPPEVECEAIKQLLVLLRSLQNRTKIFNGIIAATGVEVQHEKVKKSLEEIVGFLKANVPVYVVHGGLEALTGAHEFFSSCERKFMETMIGFSCEGWLKKIDSAFYQRTFLRIQEQLFKKMVLMIPNKSKCDCEKIVFLVRNIVEKAKEALNVALLAIKVENSVKVPVLRGIFLVGVFEEAGTRKLGFISDLLLKKIVPERNLIFEGLFIKTERDYKKEAAIFCLTSLSLLNLAFEYFDFKANKEKISHKLGNVYAQFVSYKPVSVVERIKATNAVLVEYERQRFGKKRLLSYMESFKVGTNLTEASALILQEFLFALNEHIKEKIDGIVGDVFLATDKELADFIEVVNYVYELLEVLNKMFSKKDITVFYVIFEKLCGFMPSERVVDPKPLSELFTLLTHMEPEINIHALVEQFKKSSVSFFKNLKQGNELSFMIGKVASLTDSLCQGNIDNQRLSDLNSALVSVNELLKRSSFLDQNTTKNLEKTRKMVEKSFLPEVAKEFFSELREKFVVTVRNEAASVTCKIMGPVLTIKEHDEVALASNFNEFANDLNEVVDTECFRHNFNLDNLVAVGDFNFGNSNFFVSRAELDNLHSMILDIISVKLSCSRIRKYVENYVRKQVFICCESMKKNIFVPSKVSKAKGIELFADSLKEATHSIENLCNFESDYGIEIGILDMLGRLAFNNLKLIDENFGQPLPYRIDALDRWDVQKTGAVDMFFKIPTGETVEDFVLHKLRGIMPSLIPAKECLAACVKLYKTHSVEDLLIMERWEEMVEAFDNMEENYPDNDFGTFINYLNFLNELDENLDLTEPKEPQSSYFKRVCHEVREKIIERIEEEKVKSMVAKVEGVLENYDLLVSTLDGAVAPKISSLIGLATSYSELSEEEKAMINVLVANEEKGKENIEQFTEALSKIVLNDRKLNFILKSEPSNIIGEFVVQFKDKSVDILEEALPIEISDDNKIHLEVFPVDNEIVFNENDVFKLGMNGQLIAQIDFGMLYKCIVEDANNELKFPVECIIIEKGKRVKYIKFVKILLTDMEEEKIDFDSIHSVLSVETKEFMKKLKQKMEN